MSKFAQWLKARLAEKSTYIGIATVAATVYTGPYLGVVNTLMTLLGVGAGSAMVAATTKPKSGD